MLTDSIWQAIENLAELPTSDETPGVARDELMDRLILAAREVQSRIVIDDLEDTDEDHWVKTPHIDSVDEEIKLCGFDSTTQFTEITGVTPAQLVGREWLLTHNRVFIKDVKLVPKKIR